MADVKDGAERVVYSMTDLQRPFERMTEAGGKEQGAGGREQEGSMNLPAPGSLLPASLARFKKELIATGVWERPGTDLAMEVTRERMDEWVRKIGRAHV